MLSTKARFKYTLRECKRNEEMLRADGLAKSLSEKDFVAFWRGIDATNNNKAPLPTCIDNVTGTENITNMWKEHFQSIFTSVKDDVHKSDVITKTNNLQSGSNVVFCSPLSVKDNIGNLKKGKAPGSDNLYAEHLIYAHSRLHVILSLLFNAMLVHGHVSDSLMETIIVPLIKNRTGNCSDKNNYRPLALCTALSKLLELNLLQKIEKYLYTADNQYAYKSKHSTDMAVFVLKQVIEYYNKRSTPVYVCYLDASKAFDKISYWLLFKKLLKRKVPVIYVRLLVNWYVNHNYCVQWSNHKSEFFKPINGVKQGGVLSPKLFIVYMDDLSKQLTKSSIGCSTPYNILNHIFYADDLTLLCLSAKGMQKLISICSSYAKSHNITFNASKTVCTVFEPKCNASHIHPTLFLNNTEINYSSFHKYLGVLICSKNDSRDMCRQIRSYISRVNMLCQMFSKCSTEVKIQLYNSYCTSMYAVHLWTSYYKKDFHKFRVIYNNGFRKLFRLEKRCSASGMFSNTNVMSFSELLRKNIYSFIKRLADSKNIFIMYYNSSFYKVQSTTWNHWHQSLYSIYM